MRQELERVGASINVVAINIVGGDNWVNSLVSACSFDVLQDVASVNAWTLMGGHKDDFFVYRKGGRLTPGGYLNSWGTLNTNLSTTDGYANVLGVIQSAQQLGPGEECPADPPAGGLQLPGDVNQDRGLDIADPISLLMRLFIDGSAPLPCEAADLEAPGNRALLDLNGDSGVDVSDAVYLLNYFFVGGAPPVLGTSCRRISACPEACGV